MTSSPERRRGLGTDGVKLEGNAQHRVVGEAQFGQILSFQVQRHRFAEIFRGFIKGFPLRHYSYLDAFRDVAAFAAPYDCVDRFQARRRPGQHDATVL